MCSKLFNKFDNTDSLVFTQFILIKLLDKILVTP